ncbi:response regulator transcription factor [uncultured Pseudoteredinibacter sp.]|uniref:response regulator n=1 Tax=uncultured Pseudoteredinibacter sp. TaxID=1641701 RepID=UPI00262D19B1|nr:response regulator transcription factor [uncultured Pseudoteredinibacter sp.]
MKLLSLDDHPLFSSGLKEALMRCRPDFIIESTLNTGEALSYLLSNNDVDILILDLTMPDMDGVLFMKMLIARGLNVPIVIMSANEDLIKLQEAFHLGALGFLPKTWPAEKVADALNDIHNGSIVIPKPLATRLEKMSKFALDNTQTSLSERQIEVLKLVQLGLGNQEIATTLFISQTTVKSHLQAIFKILGGKNRMECVRKATALKILSPDS